MTIPLLHFPLLVKIEVLKNMAYSDIFNLSVCSEQLHNLARLVKFRQIAKISYMFYAEIMNVGVEEHSGARHFVVATKCDEKNTLNRKHYIKIWGVKNSFKFGNGSRPMNSYFLHNIENEAIVKGSVINHCFSIFQRHSPIVQLRVLVDQSLGYLPLIERVKEMCVNGPEINVEQVAISYPDLSCLRIRGIWRDGARFSGIDNLRCDQTGTNASQVLQSFTGTFLHLFNTQITTDSLLEFCRQWQLNELCQNLKFVYIQSDGVTQFRDTIRFLEELELQEWDPSVRPERFENIPFMLDVYDCPKAIITRRFRDFQRASDGKWASLCVRMKEFFLIVWD